MTEQKDHLLNIFVVLAWPFPKLDVRTALSNFEPGKEFILPVMRVGKKTIMMPAVPAV